MSDELPDDEYHLKYDTVEMSPETYAKIAVTPVIQPTTPNVNYEFLFNQFPGLKKEKEKALVNWFAQFTPQEQINLMWKWRFWARPNQIAPEGQWTYWLLLAGRGFGKTRTGAEWVLDRVQKGVSKRIALVAPTAADVRKTMVEGESGILAKAPPWNKPLFEPSKLQLTWPNGAIAQMFSAEEPERLRGPQCDTFWADELCAWKNMQETWDMLAFGFRLGKHPQACITTTPKPVLLLKEIMSGEADGSTRVVRGSTFDNRGNLAKGFFDKVIKKYEGTRLGRQELYAEILEDMPGALWKRTDIDRKRKVCSAPPIKPFLETDEASGMVRLREDVSWASLVAQAKDTILACGEDLMLVCVAVDPNASNDEGSDEIGITVTGKGMSGQGYVLADVSLRGTPNEWASTAVLLHDMFMADRIIGEANNGGNMVETTIANAARFLKMLGMRQSDYASIVLVHASRGKVTRAEPVSMMYEQGRICHVGTHRVLEDQMCLFTTDFDRKAMGYSPDRVDSLVWGFTHLFLESGDTGILEFYKMESDRLQHETVQANSPPDTSAYVQMKAPAGVGQAYGIEGDVYCVDGEGFVFVPPKELRGLRQAGYVQA